VGKGDNRRPCLVPKEQYNQNFESVFGTKKLNVMSEEERQELNRDRDREAGGDVPTDGHEGRDLHAATGRNDASDEPSSWEDGPFWQGPGYQGEYTCPHGVGHGNHIHGCDGCCSRPDFPLKSAMRITGVPNDMKTEEPLREGPS